jgi:XTP/dITP diphosphohydrolase
LNERIPISTRDYGVTTLFIATRNAHKVQEIQSVLSDQFRYRTLIDLPDAPTVIEDANSFAGNATKKALSLALWIAAHPTLLQKLLATRTPHERGDISRSVAEPASQSTGPVCCLADDSGLEVDALDGAPGVQSARFAALDSSTPGNSSDLANNAKLLRLLRDVPLPQRTARFRCVIALSPVLLPGSEPASGVCSAQAAEVQTEIFEGVCEGHLLDAPRGTQGFGYDPLFVPNGLEQTFGELGADVKNQISHRAMALAELRSAILFVSRAGNY